MKTIILSALAIILAMCLCVSAYALEPSSSIITIGNIDVIFSADSNLTNAEKQQMAEFIVNGATNTQTYGLLCNLFGHKNTTEYVTTITHKVNSTVPRCMEEYWELIVCSRCENVESTRLSFSFINCCPVD